jgi:hypothetical protein
MRRFDPGLEQYGARSNGSHGKYGNGGIVFSVSYRIYVTNTSSNPTLSAIIEPNFGAVSGGYSLLQSPPYSII